jgi:large-conductance mechanosensitive channel
VIIPNITAYTLMAIGAYFALDFSIKHGSKTTEIINFTIMAWNVFMVMYFIKDYQSIVSSPLNERLNFFETATNWLLASWLISFRFAQHTK